MITQIMKIPIENKQGTRGVHNIQIRERMEEKSLNATKCQTELYIEFGQ